MSVLRASQQLGFVAHVVAYSVFHVAAFGVVGIVASALLHVSERESSVLAGAFVLFVVIEVGFVGFTYLLAKGSSLGNIAWYQVGAANLLSALVMGRILFKRHPKALSSMTESLRGI
ncbi:MAG: hypothetical protein U0163_19700 [Gemmatimonadaceae bacterium]